MLKFRCSAMVQKYPNIHRQRSIPWGIFFVLGSGRKLDVCSRKKQIIHPCFCSPKVSKSSWLRLLRCCPMVSPTHFRVFVASSKQKSCIGAQNGLVEDYVWYPKNHDLPWPRIGSGRCYSPGHSQMGWFESIRASGRGEGSLDFRYFRSLDSIL